MLCEEPHSGSHWQQVASGTGRVIELVLGHPTGVQMGSFRKNHTDGGHADGGVRHPAWVVLLISRFA